MNIDFPFLNWIISAISSFTNISNNESRTTCWKPLLEMDGRGFPFSQQHVASFLQEATDDTLVMNSLPKMELVPEGEYDYSTEVPRLIDKLSSINLQEQKDEIIFFDGKLNIALGIIGTLLLGYGQSIEEIMVHSFGETTAVYDSGVAVWKNKLMNSRIRPTSVIQEMYPDTEFTINEGIQVQGKYFQATVRVMPHSEYPSGSSCVCQAIEEFVVDLWPELTLLSSTNTKDSQKIFPFDARSTPIILTNQAMPAIPITNAINPSLLGYTAETLSLRCGETREEGGMHFSPAVPAGRALCAGMGSSTATKMKSLIPALVSEQKGLREALEATTPCEADCCAQLVACNDTETSDCAAECGDGNDWDLPWFDVVDARKEAFGLPDRMVATSAPFLNVDRNHLVIVSIYASLVPTILLSETIFQFRYTNTVDNIIWNAFAANSADLKVIKFGQSHEATEPIIRSGQTSSDARVITAVHAVAAAIELLLPSSVPDFENSLGNMILNSTIGFEISLTESCGVPEDQETTFDHECLTYWYNAAKGPPRLGQIIAYELMYFKVRDGWNSLGTDGNCYAGDHFCLKYADVTGYHPESGACLNEVLSA